MATKFDDAERKDLFKLWPEDVVLIGHDTEDGYEHPAYDPRVHDDADWQLMASIAAHGSVHTPITVVKDGVGPSGKPRVICKVGRGRVKAARALNETRTKMGLPREFRVPCIYEQKTTEKSMRSHVISENEQRRPDSLEGRIQKLERFLNAGGTTKEAAIHFRRTETTINMWLKFMGVARPWQQVVYTGGGSMVDVLRILTDDAGNLVSHSEQLELFQQYEEEASKPTNTKRRKKLTGKMDRGRPRGPGKRTVEKVLEAVSNEQSSFELHPEFLRALQWVSGRIDANEAGLDPILQQAKRNGTSKLLPVVLNVIDYDGMTSGEILRALPDDTEVDVATLRVCLAELLETKEIGTEGKCRGKKYYRIDGKDA